MQYNDFCGERVSRLGFGCMRFPMLDNGEIDEAQVREMVRIAMESGVNYFDTAWPYLEGKSELVIGRCLKEYPRSSWFIADKFPGHQLQSSFDPAAVFEKQLEKCQVGYFDFYLLHNVYEGSIGAYEDPRWGIIDYLAEQKRNGRIRHLGFSSHALPGTLERIADKYADVLEFCQIQLNYLDWTLQDARTKYNMLTERNIPVVVMEPVRGGKLADLDAQTVTQMKAMRPEDSPAAWSFRWLRELDGVKVILSGMSSVDQMQDNVKTFSDDGVLSNEEKLFIEAKAEELKDAVPCTACAYCRPGCPMQLDIPMLIAQYNDAKFRSNNICITAFMESLPEDKLPGACIGCGACARICPQKIDIPDVMSKFAELYKTMPSWAAVCREREEAEKRLG